MYATQSQGQQHICIVVNCSWRTIQHTKRHEGRAFIAWISNFSISITLQLPASTAGNIPYQALPLSRPMMNRSIEDLAKVHQQFASLVYQLFIVLQGGKVLYVTRLIRVTLNTVSLCVILLSVNLLRITQRNFPLHISFGQSCSRLLTQKIQKFTSSNSCVLKHNTWNSVHLHAYCCLRFCTAYICQHTSIRRWLELFNTHRYRAVVIYQNTILAFSQPIVIGVNPVIHPTTDRGNWHNYRVASRLK